MEEVRSTKQQKTKVNLDIGKCAPQGCFDVVAIDRYLMLKNYLMIKDVYNVVAPFHYHTMNYVIVKINKNGNQCFELHHEVSKRVLLIAIPKNGQIGCKILFYCPQNNNVVARLRGDLMNTKFFVFDGGHNPVKKKFPTRKQLVHISVQSQFFSNKPPQLTAILANHCRRSPDDDELQKFGTLYQSEGIPQVDQTTSQLLKAQKQNSKRIFILKSSGLNENQNQKDNPLDLSRLSPSPLNMSMTSGNQQQCFLIGKRSKNTYSLYLGAPLTVTQGFGIFLANYISKKQ